MTFTAKDARAAAAKLAKATPQAHSVKRPLHSDWRGWKQWRVEFHDIAYAKKGVSILAAKCKSERIRRYAHMGEFTPEVWGADTIVTATNRSASVRFVEQYNIGRDRMYYRLDIWARA